MRVKFLCSDENTINPLPVLAELSTFNVDDDNRKIHIWEIDNSVHYSSDKPVGILDQDVLDATYNKLLTEGYADLTTFGNFTQEVQ